MSAHVSLYSLIELVKIYKMRGLSKMLSIFRNEFDTRVIFYVRRIGLYLYKYKIYSTISVYILKLHSL